MAPGLRLHPVADRAERERAVLADSHIDVHAARIDAASRGDASPYAEPDHAYADRNWHPSRRYADARDRIDADYAYVHARADDPYANRSGPDCDSHTDEHAVCGHANADAFLMHIF